MYSKPKLVVIVWSDETYCRQWVESCRRRRCWWADWSRRASGVRRPRWRRRRWAACDRWCSARLWRATPRDLFDRCTGHSAVSWTECRRKCWGTTSPISQDSCKTQQRCHYSTHLDFVVKTTKHHQWNLIIYL